MGWFYLFEGFESSIWTWFVLVRGEFDWSGFKVLIKWGFKFQLGFVCGFDGLWAAVAVRKKA